MENLTKVIGLAPSELTNEELQSQITKEHRRVSRGFLEPRTYKGKKVGGKKKEPKEPKERKISQKAKATAAKEIEQLLGVSLEELLAKGKRE